jgi:hypothetical protein
MENKKTTSFKYDGNFLDAINMLPAEKRATACYEFCKYGITGELPKDEALAMFCVGVSVSVQKYQGSGGNHNPTGKNQWSKLVKSGQNGQVKQTETETETETKTETITKTKNIRPTLQEVKDYCLERNNSVDAEKWYDFYSAKGWKIGKEPMKDWKAAVRTWERKQMPQKKEPTVLIEDGKFFIDDSMQEYADIVKTMTDYDIEKCWKWIHDNFYGQEKPISWVRERLQQFRKGE